MNPINRIGDAICNYEQELKLKPDVIFITRRFYETILLNKSSSYMLPINGELPDIFGMKVKLINYLGSLDFQCFKSDHLNILGDCFKKDPRYMDYTLDILVPRFSSTEVSYIASSSQNPIGSDMADLKKIKIVAPNEVLKNWVSQ